jgi:hypothetical protein
VHGSQNCGSTQLTNDKEIVNDGKCSIGKSLHVKTGTFSAWFDIDAFSLHGETGGHPFTEAKGAVNLAPSKPTSNPL